MSRSTDYHVVAEVLRYLEANFRQQPSLEELASHVGLSRFRLQRLFTRWAGVSPKRFLQFLTVEYAKRRLRESEPVLSAAWSSGLSGPSRLHDLFVSTEAVTPGEFKSGGASVRIHHGFHDTPFGSALLAATPRGLCHLAFLPGNGPGEGARSVGVLRETWPRAELAENPDETTPYADAIFPSCTTLDSGFPASSGSLDSPAFVAASAPSPRSGSSLSVLLKGTNFQIKVWNALLQIPPGHLTTYSALARGLGIHRGSRAVGSAVARNPIGFLIPCHRVIRELGVIGGYRWEPVRKKAIVAWEAARFQER